MNNGIKYANVGDLAVDGCGHPQHNQDCLYIISDEKRIYHDGTYYAIKSFNCPVEGLTGCMATLTRPVKKVLYRNASQDNLKIVLGKPNEQ